MGDALLNSFVPLGAEKHLDDCETINMLIATNTAFAAEGKMRRSMTEAVASRHSCKQSMFA